MDSGFRRDDGLKVLTYRNLVDAALVSVRIFCPKRVLFRPRAVGSASRSVEIAMYASALKSPCPPLEGDLD